LKARADREARAEQEAWDRRWKEECRRALAVQDSIERYEYLHAMAEELVARFREPLLRPLLKSAPDLKARLQLATALMISLRDSLGSIANSDHSLEVEMRKVMLLAAVQMEDESALHTLARIA